MAVTDSRPRPPYDNGCPSAPVPSVTRTSQVELTNPVPDATYKLVTGGPYSLPDPPILSCTFFRYRQGYLPSRDCHSWMLRRVGGLTQRGSHSQGDTLHMYRYFPGRSWRRNKRRRRAVHIQIHHFEDFNPLGFARRGSGAGSTVTARRFARPPAIERSSTTEANHRQAAMPSSSRNLPNRPDGNAQLPGDHGFQARNDAGSIIPKQPTVPGSLILTEMSRSRLRMPDSSTRACVDTAINRAKQVIQQHRRW